MGRRRRHKSIFVGTPQHCWCTKSDGVCKIASGTNKWISKVDAYKINMQNQLYFYTIAKWSEVEVENTTYSSIRKRKAREEKVLWTKVRHAHVLWNTKSCQAAEQTRRGVQCRLFVPRCDSPIQISGSTESPLESQRQFLWRNLTNNSKSIGRHKGPRTTTIGKKVGRCELQTFHKTPVSEAAWGQDGEDRQDRIEHPEGNLSTHRHPALQWCRGSSLPDTCSLDTWYHNGFRNPLKEMNHTLYSIQNFIQNEP
jgi:hypothetical protein